MAGAGVGTRHPGSRRSFQWGGVRQLAQHAHCAKQQLLHGIPLRQLGGAAQHVGEGAVAPPT